MTENCLDNCELLSEIVVNPTPNCNLKCNYCYDEWRHPKTLIKMGEDVWDGIRTLIDFMDQESIAFSFLGGEATILGQEYYERFEDYWSNIKHRSHMQSNMTLLTDDWCQFLKDNKYTVGSSLDGVPDIHNKTRSNSFTESLRGIALAKEYDILCKILCTITNDSMPYIEESFELFALVGVPTHFNAGAPYLTPTNYHEAMQKLYEMWYDFGMPFPGIQFGRLHDTIVYRKWQDSSRPGIAGCMGRAVQVDYNGVVTMCSQLSGNPDYIIGNVLTDHPLNILQHKNRRNFWSKTRAIRARCHHCIFRWICTGPCYFSAYSRKLPYDPYCGGGAGMYRAALDRAGMTDEYAEFTMAERV